MWLGLISNLVAHSRRQAKLPAIRQLRLELTGEAQDDVALLAPVVRTIAWRILDHANPHGSEMPRAPVRGSRFAGVLRRLYRAPVGRAEWNVSQHHMLQSRSEERRVGKEC